MKTNLLKAELVKNGKTLSWLAEKMGITYSGLYQKLKHERIGVKEAELIIGLLEIKNPNDIFLQSD